MCEITLIPENSYSDSLDNYYDNFVQHHGKYGVKTSGTWRTVYGNLSKCNVEKHLNQKKWLGSTAKWYSYYGLLDIDSRPRKDVDRIRDELNMNESNSMLCRSESNNSYHILFKPLYNNKPINSNLLDTILKPISKYHRIENYPVKNKVVRLPFGKYQLSLDPSIANIPNPTWEDQVNYFDSLDNYDLFNRKFEHKKNVLDFDNNQFKEQMTESCYNRGKDLLITGLVFVGTRYQSQFDIIYYLWRTNNTPETTYLILEKWLRTKHNYMSEAINKGKLSNVFKEIERQINYVYNTYEFEGKYPDSVHNNYNGYLYKEDLIKIMKIAKGNKKEMQFYMRLLMYTYPRRQRDKISVHSDHLIKWSSRDMYLKYINKLERNNILERGSKYAVNAFSKEIRFNWKYKDSNVGIIKVNDISPLLLNDAVTAVFEPLEYKNLLQVAGCKRTTASMQVKSIFK